MTHPLKIWLAKQEPRLTMVQLAERIGVHPITLRRLVSAHESTSRELFEKIETATGGELSAVGLFAFYQSQRTQARAKPGAHAGATADT